MNSYETKQEARRARLEAAAERAEERAARAYDRADLREEKSGIPLGQPILVGHHSEGRHRRAIARADNAMRKSVEESKRADELRSKAASVGTGGISSDDPDAINKLQVKLAQLQEAQRIMVEGNKIMRRHIRQGLTAETTGAIWDAYLNDLIALYPCFKESTARAMLTPDFCGRIGYADYKLTNNRAEIKRLEKRISQLMKQAEQETTERDAGFCRIIENVEENRLQLVFDGKPDAAIRAILKSHAFKWSPRNEAWQRQLTNAARYAAACAVAGIKAKAT